MNDDKIDLISKDLEFVKDSVKDTSDRIRSLESSMSSFQKDFSEHITTDRSMANEIQRIGRTLEKNTDSLVEHMRRTEINEVGIQELKGMAEKMDSRLRPVENQAASIRTTVSLILKLGGMIGGVTALISFIYELIKSGS